MKLSYVNTKQKKDVNPLMSIKEFSEMSGIEQSTLRYWDDIGLFRPARRNPDNGYRYYSPEQIILVNFIKVLSSLNIPLKVIAGISENRSPETILSLMEQQETILDTELSRLHDAYSTIHTLRDIIKQGIHAPEPGHVSLQRLEAMPIVMGPRNEPWEDNNFYREFRRYCRHAKENRINLNNPIGGYYETMESFLKAPSVPTRFFTVDPRGLEKRHAGDYLINYTQGYFGELRGESQKMQAYADDNQLQINGPVYVLYLLDEISVQEPSAYLAQVCAALEPNPEMGVSGQ